MYNQHSFRVDKFAKKAKMEGYLTRAVYKLQEIDNKFNILNSGHSCLDLGAAPGSWTQYASKKVGHSGFVLAIDLLPIQMPINDRRSHDNIQTVQANIFKWNYAKCFRDMKQKNVTEEEAKTMVNLDSIEYGFDHIFSDMSANISGQRDLDDENCYQLWMQALQMCQILGKYNSNFIVKCFEGQRINDFRNELKLNYTQIKTFKPQASRNNSREIYLIGKGLQNKKKNVIVGNGNNKEMKMEDICMSNDITVEDFNFWQFVINEEIIEHFNLKMNEEFLDNPYFFNENDHGKIKQNKCLNLLSKLQ